jgi:hypothetical protein
MIGREWRARSLRRATVRMTRQATRRRDVLCTQRGSKATWNFDAQRRNARIARMRSANLPDRARRAIEQRASRVKGLSRRPVSPLFSPNISGGLSSRSLLGAISFLCSLILYFLLIYSIWSSSWYLLLIPHALLLFARTVYMQSDRYSFPPASAIAIPFSLAARLPGHLSITAARNARIHSLADLTPSRFLLLLPTGRGRRRSEGRNARPSLQPLHLPSKISAYPAALHRSPADSGHCLSYTA